VFTAVSDVCGGYPLASVAVFTLVHCNTVAVAPQSPVEEGIYFRQKGFKELA
jgi:hypothetical protein